MEIHKQTTQNMLLTVCKYVLNTFAYLAGEPMGPHPGPTPTPPPPPPHPSQTTTTKIPCALESGEEKTEQKQAFLALRHHIVCRCLCKERHSHTRPAQPDRALSPHAVGYVGVYMYDGRTGTGAGRRARARPGDCNNRSGNPRKRRLKQLSRVLGC